MRGGDKAPSWGTYFSECPILFLRGLTRCGGRLAIRRNHGDVVGRGTAAAAAAAAAAVRRSRHRSGFRLGVRRFHSDVISGGGSSDDGAVRIDRRVLDALHHARGRYFGRGLGGHVLVHLFSRTGLNGVGRGRAGKRRVSERSGDDSAGKKIGRGVGGGSVAIAGPRRRVRVPKTRVPEVQIGERTFAIDGAGVASSAGAGGTTASAGARAAMGTWKCTGFKFVSTGVVEPRRARGGGQGDEIRKRGRASERPPAGGVSRRFGGAEWRGKGRIGNGGKREGGIINNLTGLFYRGAGKAMTAGDQVQKSRWSLFSKSFSVFSFEFGAKSIWGFQ